MKYAVAILFLAASISTAADDAESKKLLKDLEGSYEVTSIETAGKRFPKIFRDSVEVVLIKDGRLSMSPKGGGASKTVFAITVDASKKPAYLDFGPKDEMGLGIISINGDVVKICLGDKRPTEFKTSNNDRNTLLTLMKTKE